MIFFHEFWQNIKLLQEWLIQRDYSKNLEERKLNTKEYITAA